MAMAVYSGSLLLAAQPSSSLFCSLSRLRVLSSVLTRGFWTPPITRPVRRRCLTQKVRSLSRVTASLAIGKLESRQRVRQTLSISLSPNSAMVAASLKSPGRHKGRWLRGQRSQRHPCKRDVVGSTVGVSSHLERGSMLARSNSCRRGQIRGPNRAVAAIVASPLVRCGGRMGLYKLERYSHGGHLIRVVVMALAGEVTRELSPILSWSNNYYEI
jgi:hypothetical protein